MQKTIHYFVELGYAQKVELEKEAFSNAFSYRFSDTALQQFQQNTINEQVRQETLLREVYLFYGEVFEKHLIA